ncbi:MAG: class V aminotransferase [Chloroflexi bacterium CSP1-4]|nr:MAG: class V aminotransferase [Chloroflexi bacterium CSP1-4]
MPRSSPLAAHWSLDPDVVFLNHGSFGACPTPVLEAQRAWRDRLESEPVRFMVDELEPALDMARARVAAFLRADPDDLAFVHNATSGVNTVLRSLRIAPGDEVLGADHEYNACLNAARYVAERDGARLVVAALPFPVAGPEEVVERVLAAVTPRTRLALLSHVTSPTAVVLPVAELARELAARGVEVLVDGAHAPGMLPVDLRALETSGVAYWTGNLHKWTCAPKGAAILWVRRDRQAAIRPLTISHGANDPRRHRSRFRLEFDWMGTDDPTAWLAAPAAIDFVGGLMPGGWPEVMARNHALALAGRDTVCRRLGVAPPVPDGMLGSMAAVLLPEDAGAAASTALSPLDADPIQLALQERFRIQIPVLPWPTPWTPGFSADMARRRLVRLSAQLYNDPAEYDVLAEGLAEVLAR